MKILVLDIGGTHVKALATGHRKQINFPSGPKMTAAQMVSEVRALTAKWTYEAVSIGYPGQVVKDQPQTEPVHLAPGWVGFNFEKAFSCPVKIINDAAMQALGSYRGGRMLFLGLGTGLGSALIIDDIIAPMELGHLPFKKSKTYEDFIGAEGLAKSGKKKWRRHVEDIVELLRNATQVEYVVIGGGNAPLLKELPKNVFPGDNADAFKGGYRLWSNG